MRKLSLPQFIPICIIYLFNTVIYILFLAHFELSHLYFLTTWTYWMNSIYLCVVLVCDVVYFFGWTQKLEKLQYFLRDSYCIVSMTFSYAVVILFWLLTFLGPDFMAAPNGTLETVLNFYLHGINTIFVIVDLFISEHKKIKFSVKYFIIISVIYWIYFGLGVYLKYELNFNPYTFMVNASFGQLVTSSFIMYIMVFNAYQIHLFFIHIKYKYKIFIALDNKESEIRAISFENENN